MKIVGVILLALLHAGCDSEYARQYSANVKRCKELGGIWISAHHLEVYGELTAGTCVKGFKDEN